jgi:streptomycin 6-kinase
MIQLPDEFVRHNAEDLAWLAGLRELIERYTREWALTLEPHVPHIWINFGAPAWHADGTRCVFKLSRHVGETRNEIAALRVWDGHGSARLLEADPGHGALLLERLEPGPMLSEVAERDDDQATLIVAAILCQLWLPAPHDTDLRTLESWCDAYDRNRAAILRGDTGFPTALFQRADALRAELLSSTDAPIVLHGDLHHLNVLRAQRAAWLSIDPKGLVGDPCFDVCQFFRNPHAVPPRVNARRLDIFCAELGLDRARTKASCPVHAALDACWELEDGRSWQPWVAYAEEAQSW